MITFAQNTMANCQKPASDAGFGFSCAHFGLIIADAAAASFLLALGVLGGSALDAACRTYQYEPVESTVC